MITRKCYHFESHELLYLVCHFHYRQQCGCPWSGWEGRYPADHLSRNASYGPSQPNHHWVRPTIFCPLKLDVIDYLWGVQVSGSDPAWVAWCRTPFQPQAWPCGFGAGERPVTRVPVVLDAVWQVIFCYGNVFQLPLPHPTHLNRSPGSFHSLLSSMNVYFIYSLSTPTHPVLVCLFCTYVHPRLINMFK